MKRTASAIWQGSLKEGAGTITTQSKTLDHTQYSFKTRFEDGVGTNPEELIAAAHAGCFTMQLSAYIGEAGFEIESIETQCAITMEDFTITNSDLTVNAKVSGIENNQFQELVTKAEKNCPVSKLLNAKISSTANLN